jgi:UDP-N-acetyl-D-glucosamine dehydrogenase
MQQPVTGDGVPTGVTALLERIRERRFAVGVIGLGYVGLPLAMACHAKGFRVIGFDIDPQKTAMLNAGQSYIGHLPKDRIAALGADGRFAATADFDRLSEPDALLICVPTPLGHHRDPDLSFVQSTAAAIATRLRRQQLVVLESTTYPGTTADVVRPILEGGGMRCGEDFFLGYSPEREDPGNAGFDTASIPKVIGADDPGSLRLAEALYREIVSATVPVRSSATAEAVKLTENIFRAVNIALVNELKLTFDAMGIDVWEVIDAAKTKPFGFMPFYPGPGLGGHCIPIDPFYLTWKAREFGIATRFIELAGEINTAMPQHVVARTAMALDRLAGRGVKDTAILVVGVAYKKNIDDLRESPALEIIELLERRGARTEYLDPFFPVLPPTRRYRDLAGRHTIAPDADLSRFAAAIICTDHDQIDYRRLVAEIPVIVDTRNVCARLGLSGPGIVKA